MPIEPKTLQGAVEHLSVPQNEIANTLRVPGTPGPDSRTWEETALSHSHLQKIRLQWRTLANRR